MVSFAIFANFLAYSPVGLWKFGQFLASEMNAETLVFWLNVSGLLRAQS